MKVEKYLILISIFFAGCFLSCEEEKSFNTYDAPHWSFVQGDYSESMTAVVDLPPVIKSSALDEDELAVFIGDVCRGKAEKVGSLFFVNIQGNATENAPLVFRYYSSKNRYLYQEGGKVTFTPNGVIGTVEEPYTLVLEAL